MGVGWGSSLGRRRRDRLAYLTILRRSSDYNLRATTLRGVAVLLIAVGVVVSEHRWPALLLCLPAAAAVALQLLQAHHERAQSSPRLWPLTALQADIQRANGRHKMPVETWCELVAGLLLVAVPAWVATDLPPALRLGLLVAAVSSFASTSSAIFLDHAWYNPDEADPPLWHEVVRLVAGPVTAGLVSAVALPASWPESTWLAAVAVCLAPLLVSLRVRSTDLGLAHLVPLVREESHAGRELVISETHGALSTHLRLLEQEARAVRLTAPTVYELAVSANARLRETMTLARVGAESSTTPASLAAQVLTLARAVGAKATVDIKVQHLGRDDRDLARMVLSDLVGNAVNAGAAVIGVRMAEVSGRFVIEVRDDAPPMPEGVWRSPGTSSARLESRLAGLAGSLTCEQRPGAKWVRARWAPQEPTGRGQDEDGERSSAAGGRRPR
ncbi:MAG: hypothetical protein AVDCRST_MAG61-1461 [uncultured Friedmanniella sp.]|uniref:Uncharacterized protein n=1 Tax=uncultured Friedmanniella sp. TaxID=335381 RepID=A0A6J4KL29_9ACTN|nr:hypothetical protein [uncultured Friedmanniella sp.]CAA9306396.1 MAG: hypothetical protein AVDCRST_MAG61-1461 [uncultured Friedmanniella sp.]